MIEVLFFYLLLLKHAIADLALQPLIKGGDKLDLSSHKGYRHALDHAALTLLVTSWFTTPQAAVMLAMLDFALHFWIDYFKSRYVRPRNLTMDDHHFWIVQAVDQMAHYTCYFIYYLLVVHTL